MIKRYAQYNINANSDKSQKECITCFGIHEESDLSHDNSSQGAFNKLSALQRCANAAKLLNKNMSGDTFYCEKSYYEDVAYAPDGTYDSFSCYRVCLFKK